MYPSKSRKRLRDISSSGWSNAGPIAEPSQTMSQALFSAGHASSHDRPRSRAKTSTALARIATARSRARTSTTRAQTTTGTAVHEDAYMVAVIENRAKEVGMAAYNLRSFHVELRQFADTNCFSTLMTVLTLFQPVEIILSSSSSGGSLDRAIQENPFLSEVRVSTISDHPKNQLHFILNLLHAAEDKRSSCFNIEILPKFMGAIINMRLTSILIFTLFAKRKCSIIGRKYFNDTQGAILCEKLNAESCPNLTSSSNMPKYLALASCGALMKYIGLTQGIAFEPGTMRIRLSSNNGTLFLDMATIESVELIRNARMLSSANDPSKKDCLLATVDKTKTRPGKRFLRRNLLEPPADLGEIHERQDFVEELSSDEQGYRALTEALSRIPDLEAVLANLLAREAALTATFAAPQATDLTTEVPKSVEPMTAIQVQTNVDGDIGTWTAGASIAAGLAQTIGPPSMTLIRNVMDIKTTLKMIPQILSVLENGTATLSLSIAESMRLPALADLEAEIDDVVEESSAVSRNTERMRLQGAFAVRTGRNGHLDVARRTLSENIDDMHQALERLREKLETPKLNLTMNTKRGYHFTLPHNCSAISRLDEEFIQIQRAGKVLRFSTDSLVELNSRVNESLAEIWTLTDRELAGLLDHIWSRRTISALHRLCDSIAILDLLSSFVSYCSVASVNTVRPSFVRGGPIAMKSAYHPILLQLLPRECVPNDLFMSETLALHIITGRNQSGKSTFLRTIALICILAQTGCNVPANFASLRILNNISTRFNTSDDISASQSHHSKEMQELGTILRRTTHIPDQDPTYSLVLIDELGRSTSSVDGFAIAYAVAERLAHTPRVLTLFTTHFSALGALQYTMPAVRSFHLVANILGDTQQEKSTKTQANKQIQTVQEDGNENEIRTGQAGLKPSTTTRFTYKVQKGSLTDESYGIDTARSAGIPETVVCCAQELHKRIPSRRFASEEIFARKHLGGKGGTAAYHRKKYAVQVAQQLSHLRASSDCMSAMDVCQSLRALQEKLRTTYYARRARSDTAATDQRGIGSSTL